VCGQSTQNRPSRQLAETIHTLSLRIGACGLLYEKGKSAAFIKDRLHWKSDTFMDYLRDTPIVAKQHAAALARE